MYGPDQTRSANYGCKSCFPNWTKAFLGQAAPVLAGATFHAYAGHSQGATPERLLVRGPWAWIGYTWSQCWGWMGHEGNYFLRPDEFDLDVGHPLELCHETAPGSGVWTRQWSRATATVDCRTMNATIDLHEHSARLKLDDSGEAPPPPPTISRLSTNRFPMEGVGPPVVLCTKPPLHVPAGEVVTANITQPGVSLRWPTVPEWLPKQSPLRSFPLKAPTPTGSDGCFSVDPGVTAAPGPASLSLAVGKLSTFSTKVVYYESVS
eukprot:COSAG04_NODE_7272_length_1156_cov_1.122044_2_plen_263_part_01